MPVSKPHITGPFHIGGETQQRLRFSDAFPHGGKVVVNGVECNVHHMHDKTLVAIPTKMAERATYALTATCAACHRTVASEWQWCPFCGAQARIPLGLPR